MQKILFVFVNIKKLKVLKNFIMVQLVMNLPYLYIVYWLQNKRNIIVCHAKNYYLIGILCINTIWIEFNNKYEQFCCNFTIVWLHTIAIINDIIMAVFARTIIYMTLWKLCSCYFLIFCNFSILFWKENNRNIRFWF